MLCVKEILKILSERGNGRDAQSNKYLTKYFCVGSRAFICHCGLAGNTLV